jgi:hypothetical protein
MGDVVDFPLRVLRLRTTSVARRREAAFGRTVASKLASANRDAATIPDGTPARAHCFGRVLSMGWLRRPGLGFGRAPGFEEAPVPALRLGSR